TRFVVAHSRVARPRPSAHARPRRASRRRCHMIAKQGAPSTGTPTGNLIDDARSLINDDFLEKLEKGLKLESPHHWFRQYVLMTTVSHMCVPPGGLASLSRKDLTETKEYWDAMQTHLSGLLKLLPHENFKRKEHWHARLVRIEVIGKAPQAEQ